MQVISLASAVNKLGFNIFTERDSAAIKGHSKHVSSGTQTRSFPVLVVSASPVNKERFSIFSMSDSAQN